MTDRPDFRIEIHQDRHLPMGETRVHAIARIDAVGGSPGPAPGDAGPATTGPAEVIIIDTSGSMVGERLVAAKRAAKTAVDGLREDAVFAVVAGSHQATMVYPRDPLLARASDDRKELAKSAISKLTASGGTRLGRWLTRANELFAEHEQVHPYGVRHAILLTDGKNQHEQRVELDTALAACTGHFVCDCRGIGTDWAVPELRRVADRLMGGVARVADPDDLPADFAAMVEAVMGPAVADVALRIWTPHQARLRFVKQVFPSIRDLTSGRVERGRDRASSGHHAVSGHHAAGGAAGPATGDYPTGLWGPGRRDYHLCVMVPAGEPYDAILAARVSLVLPGADDSPALTLAAADVRAEWTDDEARSTEVHPWIAHYSLQAELADSVQQAIGASNAGDPDTAGRLYGQAVGIAEELGYEEMTYRLGHVVDIDPATGVVRAKDAVDRGSEMDLDVKSVYTIPPPDDRPGADPAAAGREN